MQKGKNLNRPVRGSTIKVEPKRRPEHIQAIKRLVSENPRKQALFTLVLPNFRAHAFNHAIRLQSLTLEELQTYRTEAIAALAKLHAGARRVSVAFADQRHEYQPGEADQLERWITKLQSAITAKQTGRPSRAPLYVTL